MRKTLLMCGLAMLMSIGAFSQIIEPVKWSYSSKRTSATTATVYIKAIIDKGWHLYSQIPSDGGPTPTTFTFAPSTTFERIGKTIEIKPITKFEPVFFTEVSYFENTAIFQQKVKLKSNGAVVKGKVEFMACNDKMCLPTSEREFSIKIK